MIIFSDELRSLLGGQHRPFGLCGPNWICRLWAVWTPLVESLDFLLTSAGLFWPLISSALGASGTASVLASVSDMLTVFDGFESLENKAKSWRSCAFVERSELKFDLSAKVEIAADWSEEEEQNDAIGRNFASLITRKLTLQTSQYLFYAHA